MSAFSIAQRSRKESRREKRRKLGYDEGGWICFQTTLTFGPHNNEMK